jgi:hypothetical protein
MRRQHRCMLRVCDTGTDIPGINRFAQLLPNTRFALMRFGLSERRSAATFGIFDKVRDGNGLDGHFLQFL